jgi:hypothetical protein
MLRKTCKDVLLFPITIYRACLWLPIRLRGNRGHSRVNTALGLLLYGLIGLPLSILLLLEMLIVINTQLMAQPMDDDEVPQQPLSSTSYNPTHHWPGRTLEEWPSDLQVTLPGYVDKASPPPDPTLPRDQFYDQLLASYSPTILHKMGHEPLWDIPTDIFFDGDTDPRNNVSNALSLGTVPAVVHGEVIAETHDAYYLTYMLYHVKDYDLPVREALSDATFHDGDNEGIQLRIDKASMQVTLVETWFHNRFFLCNRTGESQGTEPIQTRSLFEGGTHIVLFVQSMGHGVRCASPADFDELASNSKILRLASDPDELIAPGINDQTEYNIGYQLASLKPWYRLAKTHTDSGNNATTLFEDTILLGTDPTGREIQIGKFFAANDFEKRAWSRPKPPWAWDDRWDDIPAGLWHFHPALAFNSHTGETYSEQYHHNAPMSLIFTADERYTVLTSLLTEHYHRAPQRLARKTHPVNRQPSLPPAKKPGIGIQVKRYMNYVIHSLG